MGGELSLVTDGLTCDFDECRENNGGCAELCINVLGGNECGCSVAGYSVTFDGVTCADTNECAIDNGGCSDQCHNTDGGFYCSCVAGRMLGADGSTCTHDPCWVDNGSCQLATPPSSKTSTSVELTSTEASFPVVLPFFRVPKDTPPATAQPESPKCLANTCSPTSLPSRTGHRSHARGARPTA